MTTHTPGPWHVGSAIYIRAGNNYVVAKLEAPIHMHNEITDANARLIAAAPTMLQALKACERHIDDDMNGRPVILWKLRETVLAAISEAMR